MSKPVISFVAMAVAAVLAPKVTLAQSAVVDTASAIEVTEVIEVTSTFKPQNIMRVEGSISVLGPEQISAKNALHSETLLNSLANVNFSTGASRGNYVQIRGIGMRAQFTDTIDPSVAYILDGINYSGLGGAALLFDAEQFELYRGPQGTAFGTDAMAGVINIDTGAATNDQITKIHLGLANFGGYSVGVAGGGALTQRLNVRGALINQGSDGYIENDYLNVDDTNARKEVSAKLKANWTATDDLTIDGVVHLIDIDNGYDAFSIDQNGRSQSDEPGRDLQKTYALGLTSTYQGFETITVSLLLNSLKSELEYSFDEDWANSDTYVEAPSESQYKSFDRYLRDRRQNSADLRLLSKGNTLFDNTTSWVGGLYLNQRDVDLVREHTGYADFTSEHQHRDIAAYGQFAIDLSPQTELVLGARLGYYHIEYTDSSAVNISDNLIGLHASLNHQLNEQALIYISASRSDKAGGINGQARANVANTNLSTDNQALLKANPSFDPETLYTIEYGVKGRSLDDKLQLKLAAFYNYRQNQQVINWVTHAQTSTFVEYFDNAGSGRGYGLEIETSYQLNHNLELVANLGYLETKLKGFASSTGMVLDDRQMAHAPQYQFAVGINYQADNGFFASIETTGKDSYYFSDSHNQQSDFYAITNVNLGYQAQDWRLNLWARNVFDRDYATRGLSFGNDPRDGYTEHSYTQRGEPAVFGLTLDLEL